MATANEVERAGRNGVLLGIPVGDLGWFSSLIIGLTTGIAAFFGSTCIAIFVFLFYRVATNHNPDFSLTYKLVGLPVGIVVMVVALVFLGVRWCQRMARKRRVR